MINLTGFHAELTKIIFSRFVKYTPYSDYNEVFCYSKKKKRNCSVYLELMNY